MRRLRRILCPDDPGAGLPAFDSISRVGTFAPAGTPPPVVARITRDASATVHAPDVEQRVNTLSAIPVGDSPQEFDNLIAQDRDRYARLIAKIGIPKHCPQRPPRTGADPGRAACRPAWRGAVVQRRAGARRKASIFATI